MVAKTVIRTSDDADHFVGRSETAHKDIEGQLTVICQICRCLARQTLKDQDGDLEGYSLMHGQPVRDML